MPLALRLLRVPALVALLFLSQACTSDSPDPGGPRPLSLTIAHVNDTHSALEPTGERLMKVGDAYVYGELGGFARLRSAREALAAEGANVLLLHAGDAVQGTLYFTLFDGAADVELLNDLGVEAMVPGNHEFDRGPELLGALAGQAAFPLVSANVDVAGEPALAGRVQPYAIKRYGGESVAVVGVTTAATPGCVASVGAVRFYDETASVAATVRELEAEGVNKVLVLSHLGYEGDRALARQVRGVDVIVGGHSHTLLGDAAGLSKLGLAPAGPYPTVEKSPEGKDVLIVQARENGEELGVLDVRFDERGDVASYAGRPEIVVGDAFTQNREPVDPGGEVYAEILAAVEGSGAARVEPEDPATAAKLAPYKAEVEATRAVPVGAVALEDLTRGPNSGPGPLIADGMAWKLADRGAEIALLARGEVRRDLPAGPISKGAVLEVLPYFNKLLTLDLTGGELLALLEEAVAYQLRVYPTWLPPYLPYVSGATYAVDYEAAEGSRVRDLRVRGEQAAADASYRVAVDEYLAGGGDGFSSLKGRAGAWTALYDSEVFAEYLAHLGTVANPTEERVAVVSAPAAERAAGSPSAAIPGRMAASR